MTTPSPSVILFDGVCNLCNGTIDFVIRHDHHRRFRFASLQAATSAALIQATQSHRSHLQMENELSTVFLIENGKLYRRSTAILRILRGLGFPWSLLSIFFLIPTPIRDFVYGVIARHRYRWFGKRDTCRLPTAEEKTLFI